MPPTVADPRHLLVIGAGPGIGAAVASRFARGGFRITLLARREESLLAIATALREHPVDVVTVVADAADSDTFREALETIAAGPRPPGVVVYNAALVQGDNLLTASAERLASAYAVDLIGAVITAQVFTPSMESAGSGTLLLTSGSLALHPRPGSATLSLGKAALRAAGTMLAADLQDKGIHVTSVTIAASIKADTVTPPEAVAELYWKLNQQPQEEWRVEAGYPDA